MKGFQRDLFANSEGGANAIGNGYSWGDALGAEIIGTFMLVYTVFCATDAKRSARDSHVPVSKLGADLQVCASCDARNGHKVHAMDPYS